jgi:hypothetical protein
MHKEIAGRFGNQPEQVIRAAEAHKVEKIDSRKQDLESALTYARDKNLERRAVADERELMRDALKRSMGEASFAEIRERFEKRIQSGDFIEVENKSPGRAFTTEKMIHLRTRQRGGNEKGTRPEWPAGKLASLAASSGESRALEPKPTRHGGADPVGP